MGLVKTTEDFGVRGEVPSHPELLDWLATELIRVGWDIKAMQKLIVMSATYRQSSKDIPELLKKDPENRLLARGPRFRLPAEVVRDNALAISGLLAEKVGGPSVKPYQPAGLWEELAGGAGEDPYVQDKGLNLYRRSLYVYRKRTVPHPAMATFDAPSHEICQVKRQRTDTPLQALALLNDVTYVEAARQLGLPQPGFPATRGNALDDLYQAERGLVDGYAVIPLFHLPVASAASARVHDWAPDQFGEWSQAGHSLADLWLADRRLADSRADSRPEAGPR